MLDSSERLSSNDFLPFVKRVLGVMSGSQISYVAAIGFRQKDTTPVTFVPAARPISQFVVDFVKRFCFGYIGDGP